MSDWFPAAPPGLGDTSEDLHRRSELLEARLHDAFQVNPARSKLSLNSPISGPDMVLDAGPVPTAIELKLTTRPSRFLASSSRLVSQAVRYRRQFHGAIKLILIVVVAPTDQGHKASLPSNDHMRRLLRGAGNSDGFDQVLVSFDGSPSRWWAYTPERETPEQFEGLASAVSRIRQAASIGAARSRNWQEEASSEMEVAPSNDELLAPRRVLLVADEWASRHGGISTINRGLAIGFANSSCQVAVAVPSATPDEIEEAKSANIDLVSPDPLPGVGGKEALLLPPRFDIPGWEPDLIIGHGRILGPYAYAVQNNYFTKAKRIHIVHMDPRRLEKAKEAGTGLSRMDPAEERDAVEIELAVSSDVVAGVGATLAEYIDDAMRGRANPRRPVVTLIPGLKKWEEIADPSDPPTRRKILLIARADDIRSKGIDLAVRAVRQAVLLSSGRSLEPPTLVVRGVPNDLKDEIQTSLNALAQPDMEVYLQPYSTTERDLLADLLSSRVVLMPSRHEGFGLVGLEAMAAGVPVLVTGASGLARLLMELPGSGDAGRPREILDVTGEPEMVEERWARAIQRILDDPEEAYRRAATLRNQLAERLDWAKSATELLDAATIAPARSDPSTRFLGSN